MSLVNALTGGLVHKDGEFPSRICGSCWKYGDYWVSTKIVLLPIYITRLPIFLLSLLGVRWAKRIMGRALGYGGCSYCGMTWNYVKGKSIAFSESSGMFPLCEECFSKLLPEEIDGYIDQLIGKWMGFGWHEGMTPEEVATAAKAEVRRMKGQHD